MSLKKGFTLIELLVVISIIGMLATVAAVSLNSSRQRGRDAKRIADVKAMQSALELYFNDQQAYPATPAAITGCAAGVLGCGRTLSSGAGFGTPATGTTYMANIPSAPLPGVYTYTGSGTTYTLTFDLEAATSGLAAGTRTASPSGIQ